MDKIIVVLMKSILFSIGTMVGLWFTPFLIFYTVILASLNITGIIIFGIFLFIVLVQWWFMELWHYE